MRIKSKVSTELVVLSIVFALISYWNMRSYIFTFWPVGRSDFVGFYVTRFPDHENHWPYHEYQLLHSMKNVLPIEYPVLTGVIVWFTKILTPTSDMAKMDYFALNSFFVVALFAISCIVLYAITDKQRTRLFVYSPAVLFALFLNWDLWAVLPLLLTILYFEKEKFNLSAVFLGVAVAVKFFPVVLIIPISIYFLRNSMIRNLGRYLSVCAGVWLILNIPVMLYSFEGWKYFYQFSASRYLGDGSIYNILAKFGLKSEFPMYGYYCLNAIAFAYLIFFLLKNSSTVPLKQSAILSLIAFTYFGKQYSMQYVLWLAPLAVIAIQSMGKAQYTVLTRAYVFWQTGELAIHWGYFQNVDGLISDLTYALLATYRYSTLLAFVYLLARAIKVHEKNKKVKK